MNFGTARKLQTLTAPGTLLLLEEIYGAKYWVNSSVREFVNNFGIENIADNLKVYVHISKVL